MNIPLNHIRKYACPTFGDNIEYFQELYPDGVPGKELKRFVEIYRREFHSIYDLWIDFLIPLGYLLNRDSIISLYKWLGIQDQMHFDEFYDCCKHGLWGNVIYEEKRTRDELVNKVQQLLTKQYKGKDQ
jgi:hypothetical protein